MLPPDVRDVRNVAASRSSGDLDGVSGGFAPATAGAGSTAAEPNTRSIPDGWFAAIRLA
jgi:phage head maturation protease